MAKYSAIKAAVNAYIKANGRKEITGSILNSVLRATIDSLGRFFQFAGGALPTDDPGTPDQNVCYLAGEPGLYTHFGNIRIENEEVALLFWDGEWQKQSILIGIREVNASVDNQVGTPSVDVNYSQGQLVLTFHNLKGGKGDTGDPAGFGTISADITGGVGTPGVSVQTSGDNTAKNLMFHFTNLKGETGVTSVVATIDNTTGTPSCLVSLENGQLTLAFSGLKGMKGDTGVSADYPITIYNGLDSDATDQALAAAQGGVLEGEITYLRQDLKLTEYAFPVTGNMPAGTKVFRFIVKTGESFVVRANFDTDRVPKIGAFYSCDKNGGNRTSLKSNMYPDTDYLFTAATDTEYFTIYCTGITNIGDDSFRISFRPETSTYQEIDALDEKTDIIKAEALRKASGDNVPINIVQGNYASGIPNSGNTKRVRPDRMISIDELPISFSIPNSVDAKISSIVLYSRLDDYSSYEGVKTFVERPKSIIIQKADIGNYAGFAFVMSKESDDTATISPSDVSDMTISYYDEVLDVRDGIWARGRFYTDNVGLLANNCVFRCPIERGKLYLIEAITDSSANAFVLYSCDSTGNSRTTLRKNAPVNKKFWLTAPQDSDYLCVYCPAPTTKGNFTIVVYDDAAKTEYLNAIGVSGVQSGNFFYYGDRAISIREDAKCFRGKSGIFLSQNYYDGMVQHRNQSMAIYGKKIFCFQDTSIESVRTSGEAVTIYDYDTKQLVGSGNNPVTAHCNNAQFTDIFWDENDEFPLLMLSNGDYPSANSPYFHLLRISVSGTDYTFTIVKTMSCTIPAALNNGSWIVNCRQKRLWMYTLTNGTFTITEGNRFALYEFEMPDFTTGDPVTLTETDVVRYSEFDYCILQGGTEHGGLLYLPVQNASRINGEPFSPEDSTANGVQGILVVDPNLGRIINVVPFTGPEPEGIAICESKILVSQKNGNASSQDQLAFQIQEFDFGPAN